MAKGLRCDFVECEPGEALSAGDDAVDALLDEGWHPVGQPEYWASFWDADQVFYGHVLGFKGLERRAVVLVLNETATGDRSPEQLYVGMSGARHQLVVCGSSEVIGKLGGEDVLRHITGGPIR